MFTKEYLAWNQVLFEKFYSERSAGIPVYLDLEDSVFEELSSHPLLTGSGALDDLVQAVRGNIDFTLNKDQVFLKIENETNAWIHSFWRNHGDAIPPMLPLLALTVLAAERMGGDGSASNAYYKHFNEILGIANPKQQESVEESYRKSVIFLWKALNRWLVDRQGLNGEYTAYSLSYVHIGAALSQALVRDIDRKKLPRMFEYLRLEPGSQVSIPDMKELFAVWLTKDEGGVSQGLRNLWTKESARNGIAEVLCVELSKWDGAAPGKATGFLNGDAGLPAPGKLRITLRQSSKLMQKRFEFGLGFNPSNSGETDLQEFVLASDSEVSATPTRKSPSLATLSFQQAFKADNLLEGKIDLVSPAGEVLRRLPRNLVLLSRDEDSGTWVEIDRAGLGQELTLLVRLDSNAWSSLLTFLNENARPGFEFATSDAQGLPTGWGLIELVQIVNIGSITAASEELRSLVPVSGSQLAFRGGLRLPSTGSFRYWLASMPPVVEAVGQPGQPIKLEVYRLDLEADSLVGTTSTSAGVISFDLAAYTSEPGNYRATLFEGKTAVAQREFYLRDSRQPDPIAARTKPKLGHVLKESMFAYVSSATEVEPGDATSTSGLWSSVDFKYPVTEEGSFGTKSSWLPDELVGFTPEPINLFPLLDSNSCAFTGRHRWELGTCEGAAKYVLGVCSSCGDQKLQLCNAYLAQRAKDLKHTQPPSLPFTSERMNSVPPVLKNEKLITFDWVTAYEVLNYCIHGSVSSLTAALEPLATAKISATQAISTLESRGVIEIQRDVLGKPIRWSLPDKALVTKEEGKLHFAGFWSLGDLKSLTDLTGAIYRHNAGGVTPDMYAQLDGAARWSDVLPQEHLELIANAELWKSLPKLSEVQRDAPRQVLPEFERFEQLDLDSGQWVASARIRPSEGAFRAWTKFGPKYFFASERDLSNGKAVSNSASLVKWLAANASGVEILAYSEDDSALYVPLGAQLPPFYARSLAFVTCELPKTVTTKSGKALTKYPNVPKIVASALRFALTN